MRIKPKIQKGKRKQKIRKQKFFTAPKRIPEKISHKFFAKNFVSLI